MSGLKAPKIKRSFWETLKAGSGPYRRLFQYVKPYKVRFGIGLGFGFAYGAINGLLPIVLAKVMAFVFQGGAAPMTPRALMQGSSQFDAGPKIDSLVVLCLAIPGVMMARSLCSYLNSYYMAWVGNKVLTDIRTQLFQKILSHSMDFFNRSRSGFLMSRITNDTRMMQMALSNIGSDLFKMPVAILVGVAVLLYLDWKFTIVTLFLFPLCIIPISIYGRKARRAAKMEQEDMGQMVVTMQETFAGIRVIKSFAREEHQEKIFRHSNKLQFDNSIRIVRAMESVGPMVETIAAIGVGLALLYVYFMQVSAARFLALNMGIFLLYEPLKVLSKIQIIMERSIQATTEIFAILDSKPSVVDAPDAIELPFSSGRIDLKNVSFRYAGGRTDAVHDVSLAVEAGKTYALVGSSGAGKSTILSLLLRLYDPTNGEIRIDGRDIREVTQKSLRKQVGLVTQETFLFHDTIFSNIQFGRLKATRDEVYAAAQAAFAHDFIMAQPQGYETVIGDKGCLLSGGQQQRLAIARALLKNAPILLLDEATSALDSESEKQIQIALENLSAGRTVIAIAHRLSTILSADQIVVMEEGHIKEIGTHAELIEQSGYYRRLYDMQFNRKREEEPVPAEEPEFFVESLA
ncbi:MAG: ABC transporter ATP-binding protein/permease [Verrucomicrobiota bacterium]|nr:ABC transporter ATP-binding protein/permease [Verrucomicrobiota bacterium]